jgi:hypothetical protein
MDMNAYILISIVVLAVIVLLLFVAWRARSTARLTPLAGIAFAFVLAGMMFGENRLLGYSLLGVGVVLAVVDIVLGLRRK